MVKRRQFMDINVVGFLPPTERGLRPQFLLKVVLAQVKRDHRRAVFYRRTHKGVLVYLRDSRRKLHLHGHRHLPPFAITDVPRIRGGEDSSMMGAWTNSLTYLPGIRSPSCPMWEACKLPNK